MKIKIRYRKRKSVTKIVQGMARKMRVMHSNYGVYHGALSVANTLNAFALCVGLDDPGIYRVASNTATADNASIRTDVESGAFVGGKVDITIAGSSANEYVLWLWKKNTGDGVARTLDLRDVYQINTSSLTPAQKWQRSMIGWFRFGRISSSSDVHRLRINLNRVPRRIRVLKENDELILTVQPNSSLAAVANGIHIQAWLRWREP